MTVRQGLGRTLMIAGTLVLGVGGTALRLHESAVATALDADLPVSPSWVRPDLGAVVQMEGWASLREQPLLYAARAPYVAPVQTEIPTAPPPPSYRLAGTMVTPRKPAQAILVPPAGMAAVRRVKPGDDVDGWKVDTVEVNRVVLTYADQSIEIAKSGTAPATGIVRATAASRGVAASGMTLSAAGSGERLLSAAGGVRSAAPRGKAALLDQARLYRPPPR